MGQRTKARLRANSRWILKRFQGSELTSYQRHFCHQRRAFDTRERISEPGQWPRSASAASRLSLQIGCFCALDFGRREPAQRSVGTSVTATSPAHADARRWSAVTSVLSVRSASDT
jgi:hypothetical protein